MRIPYTKLKSKDPLSGGASLRPYLAVNFLVGFKSVRTRALLDTGADRTILNRTWAEVFGLDWKKGIEFEAYGIANISKKIYIHRNIDIEIINFPNSRKTIDLAFIESPAVNVLLGRLGFFEHFRVTFDQPHNFFEITLP